MYIIYVNNMLPLALAVHEITRHFWAAYENIRYVNFDCRIDPAPLVPFIGIVWGKLDSSIHRIVIFSAAVYRGIKNNGTDQGYTGCFFISIHCLGI